MGKKIKVPVVAIIFVIIVLAVVLGILIASSKKGENKKDEPQVSTNEPDKPKSSNGELTVVPTMNDEITTDSAWCATFQLVWNDMKNEVVKKDIVFDPQISMVENLNKEDFDETMLSDEYYYKIYGPKTLELKEKIEKGIEEKFNQTSDILDQFDWSEDALDDANNPDISRYFFYTMLYRNFEFLKEFDKLENGKFAGEYDNVEYFGINGETNEEVGNQIEVLYYNSQDDFAVLVNTKNGDEVIFCKNPEGTTFNEIYENMNKKTNEYMGNTSFQEIDEFKAPNINIDQIREYYELEGNVFETEKGYAQIAKAIQSIKFSLNEKGGELKSEAAIDMVETTAIYEPGEKKKEPRYFYVDNTFALFLREEGSEKPYFAATIDDISKLQ